MGYPIYDARKALREKRERELTSEELSDEEIFKRVGRNIRLLRRFRRLTCKQTALLAGIDRSTLYKIERGHPRVSMGSYYDVLKVLGKEYDFLKLAEDMNGLYKMMDEMGYLRKT